MITQDSWIQYFPHETPRPVQIDAINRVLNTFLNTKKKFVIAEMGTGCGKSAIGVTVARYLRENVKSQSEEYLPGAYFVTTQKILQDQYVKDFGGYGPMRNIKSSSNYQCKFHAQNSCSESQALLRTAERDSRFFKVCSGGCVYRKAKEAFLKSSESVVNFPYFLTEATYSGKITPRNFLVLDEVHNAEDELSRFIEVTISERFVKNTLKMKWPGDQTQFQSFSWIKNDYFPKVKDRLSHIEGILKKFDGLKDKLDEFAGFAKQHDMLKSHVDRLSTFIRHYDKENWVCEFVAPFARSLGKIIFKPVDVSKFANDYLFRLGNKVLMMSATIVNHKSFCKSLGVPKDSAEFISTPSPFPTENRPIIELLVGKMNAKEIDNTLPLIAKTVEEILKMHPNEKGIIHCHTFKIAKYLWQYVRHDGDRLLIHDSNDREEVLEKHMHMSKPTVLLSPSMAEGVDLRGDFSRFQVICKVPFPYLGDKVIKKRMSKWPEWYPTRTAKTIVQAVGRSVRSSEDHAVTYILDEGWRYFYKKHRDYFPQDFRECLQKY